MLGGPRDSALLRFGLGAAYLKSARKDEAVTVLQSAVALDPMYSAAWKLLGKALQNSGQPDAAREAFKLGITAAETWGDIQAAKEMKVFLRRLTPTPSMPSGTLMDRHTSPAK